MNLLEFAQKRINPTPDQKAVFKALDDFLQSSEKCFLLKGYAGTGKTTITKVITEYIRHKKMLPRLFAPTGRAARILSDKTGYEASTIHKGMYNIDDVDEIEVVSNGKKQYKYRYNLNTIDSNIIEVFLVDEASMISDKKSEQDFFVFGSGVLLKDILTIVSPWNTARKIKIIFIGDPAQLPPVSDSISGALSAFYLKKTYDITTLEYEMTDVVRQEQNSGILKLANYLRNRLLNTSKKSIFEIKTESDDIVIIEPREVAEQYQKLNPGLKLNETVVINFSNKEALDYNLTIRERYFQNKYQIGVGDLMMITQIIIIIVSLYLMGQW